MRLFPAILMALAAGVAHAQWQADVSSGQDDAVGILLFFGAFVAYAYCRDEFKQSKAKGWTAVGICAVVLWAAYMFTIVRMIAAVLFLASMVHFAWERLRGPRR